MSAIKATQEFSREISKVLRSIEVACSETENFINTLIREIDSAKLRRNSVSPKKTNAPASWQFAINEALLNGSNLLLEKIVNLEPYIAWMNATRFWPEEEHRHFASKLSGAILIGPDDAEFSADEKFISLLGAMSPNTTYPLHEHRIRELYYVVSGHAGWSHDAKKWKILPPGSVFFNRSHEPHTIRTDNQSLIFVSLYLPPFGWEGGMVEVLE